jgi:multidrug resistance efflux pump
VKDLLLQALRRYVEVEEAFDGAGSVGEVEELCKKTDACAMAAVAKARAKKAEQELQRVEAELQQANALVLRLKKQIAKYCPKCPDYKEIRRELIKAGILKPKSF